MSIQPKPETEEHLKMTALYIAMVVRNGMENFHCKHLSDEQMKELNPLIREAIYNALYARANFENSLSAQRFVQYHTRMIPPYWEPPRLYDFLITAKITNSLINTLEAQKTFGTCRLKPENRVS